MSEVAKVIKEYGGIGALITVLLGGGVNILSESGENTVISELHEDHAELLQKFNDLDKEVALMRQRLELQ